MEELKEIELLGAGAFGKCYLCIDPQDNTKVVVKQIDVSSMEINEKKEAYHEAKIMSAFDHPNIIRFRDVYTTPNGKLNIVMDYADGGDLATKIKAQKGKYFAECVVLDIFVQLCLAMKHVHDRKILHRDIKAQNIFLMKSGIVKLGDFGIAKVLTKTMDKACTMVGTPYYLSPEIVDNKPYNYKSDVWSLGVLLYELCTLKPPFDASSFHFLALKIVRGAYPPLPANFSRDLRTLVSQMLAIDPNKRPSIAQILKMPFINRRIQNLLSESIKKQEFSHTILHNQQFVDNDEERPPARPSGETRGKATQETKAKIPEETKAKAKTKSKKIEKAKKPAEKVLSIEEKKKIREEKARKREEDRLKMAEDIQNKMKGSKPAGEMVQWLGTNKEESRIIHELQNVCNDTEEDTVVTEDTSISNDLEEMVVKNDVIHSDSNAPSIIVSDSGDTSQQNLIDPPVIMDRSTHTRMELHRLFLEQKLGIELFLEAYNLLKIFIRNEEKWDYENIYQKIKGLMDVQSAKEYLPIIHSLIFMEGQSEGIN